MNYELVVAMSKNGVIGKENKIPWYLPEDLIRFSKLTKGSIIIMGRKTFESLPNGPLQNRLHLVLSNTLQNNDWKNANSNVIFVNLENINSVIEYYIKDKQKIFIIGGSEIYKLFMRQCNKLHITMIDEIIEGDSYFPYYSEYLDKCYTPLNNSNGTPSNSSTKLPVTISNDAPTERSILNVHGYKLINKTDILYSKNKNIKYQYFTYGNIEYYDL